MNPRDRRAWERRSMLRKVCRQYRRDIVSVVEVYKTKRNGTPVGEATLTCGHTALVDMHKPAKWRICWTCQKAGVTLLPSAPTGEAK